MQTNIEVMKRCSKCGVEKSVADFYTDKRRRTGLFSACKFCHNILSRRWASINKDRKCETNRLWQLANSERRRAAFLRRYARTDAVVPATKLCSACGLQLSASEFHKKKDAADGLYPLCKSCRSETDKELRKSNIERYREYDRARYHSDPSRLHKTDWYQANREKTLKKSAAYAIANPEIVRAAKKSTWHCMAIIQDALRRRLFPGLVKKKSSLFL